MYPTSLDEIEPQSNNQIKTGLELKRPKSGSYTNLAAEDKWTSFNISNNLQVIVLEVENKGNTGIASRRK